MKARNTSKSRVGNAPLERSRSRCFKFSVFAVCLVALPFAVRSLPLRLNTTPSLPIGLYALSPCHPQRGEIVVHTLSSRARTFAEERGYVQRHARGLLKTIVAVPGDRLCWMGKSLQINGRQAAIVSPYDHLGRALPHPDGCMTLGPRQMLPLIQDNPQSYDGRYYGPVKQSNIKACARRVL